MTNLARLNKLIMENSTPYDRRILAKYNIDTTKLARSSKTIDEIEELLNAGWDIFQTLRYAADNNEQAAIEYEQTDIDSLTDEDLSKYFDDDTPEMFDELYNISELNSVEQ